MEINNLDIIEIVQALLDSLRSANAKVKNGHPRDLVIKRNAARQLATLRRVNLDAYEGFVRVYGEPFDWREMTDEEKDSLIR